MKKEIKFAVIGTSWITEAFLEAAEYAGGMRLCGICSRPDEKGNPRERAKQLGERFGTDRFFGDCRELSLCDEIEAVYVASPNSLHYVQSKLLLQSGKHVICEKPVAVTPQEVSELVELSREKGLVYMEAIMFLYMPELELLKAALKRIGRITSASLDFSQLSSKYAALKRGELPNIFNPLLCTGSLMDLGVYNVYTAVELFGVPEKITATARFLSTGADGSGAAFLDYGDKLVTLTYSKTGQSYAPSQIFGDEGTVLIESFSQLQNIRLRFSENEHETVCTQRARKEVMSFEAAAFRDFILYPEKREKLSYAQELSLSVSRIMAEIRNQSKITFKKH